MASVKKVKSIKHISVDTPFEMKFGKYVSVESAITIGMYPDMEREKMINAGNSSLEGAQKLLLNKELLADIDQILEEMTYIQFAEVDDFLEQMVAAQALPHTDYKKYPTVMEKLKKRINSFQYAGRGIRTVFGTRLLLLGSAQAMA